PCTNDPSDCPDVTCCDYSHSDFESWRCDQNISFAWFKLHYPAAADYALGRNLRLDRLQMQQRVVGKDIAAQSRDIKILFQGSQAFNMPVERLSDSGKLLASGCFFAHASGFTHREEGIQ
ncbi:hypothetical protein FOL46_002614, partial [Perkinsus olseni]